MKFLMASGGFFGFATVSIMGFVMRRDPGRVVMEAAIASVIGALLCRWLYGFMARSVNVALEEKRKARINEATSEAMKKAAAAGPKS